MRPVLGRGKSRTDAESTETFRKAFRSKVGGTWVLHSLTRSLPLDFFILLSSAASVWGGRAQGHYAAANRFLDAIAYHRRALGLTATTINLGPVSGGMTSATAEEGLDAIGLRSIEPSEALHAMMRLAQAKQTSRTVARVQWDLFRPIYETQKHRLLNDLEIDSAPPTKTSASDFLRQIQGLTISRAQPLLEERIRAEVARVLRTTEFSDEQGFRSLGMDSLMAVELMKSVRELLGRRLPTTLAFEYPTVASLASYLVKELAPAAPVPSSKPEAVSPQQRSVESDLDGATEEQLAILLSKELRGARERTGQMNESPVTLQLRNAVGAVRDARARINDLERQLNEPIAVIGMGCRFPGNANDADHFWRLLVDGVDAVSEVPEDRWSLSDWYDADPDAPGKSYSRHGGFLGNVDRFDAAFFGIVPGDATVMDPQHRLLLEVTSDAFEHAGLPLDGLVGTQTGVFIGVTANDYSRFLAERGAEAIDAYYLTGNALNFSAGRISYTLGLNGPALAVDTACSSSLVAIHLACESLRLRGCNLAVAGGVNLMLAPTSHVMLSKSRVLSPTGRCRTFDAAADGIVRGEGCGIVVLKRLSDAQQDGDTVLAVVRGSAVNQDGRSSGLTVPNKQAQEAVIRTALERAGAQPSDVSYVEAHGTGTPLGDPIEIRALGSALCQGRARIARCWSDPSKPTSGIWNPLPGLPGSSRRFLRFSTERSRVTST